LRELSFHLSIKKNRGIPAVCLIIAVLVSPNGPVSPKDTTGPNDPTGPTDPNVPAEPENHKN